MDYSAVVFDTAPTGHTLRFLSFPGVLEKALGKLSQFSGRFGPMLQQMSGMMGMNPQEDMFAKLEGMREVIQEVNAQFQDPVCGLFALVISECVLLTNIGCSYFHRTRQLSSVFAYPSSCLCMKPSV
jgi:arsenite-transporting ATPase